jgi:hypothetical protein
MNPAVMVVPPPTREERELARKYLNIFSQADFEPYARPAEIPTAAVAELRKMLGAMTRVERFCDGTFVAAARNGALTAALKRIVEEKSQ